MKNRKFKEYSPLLCMKINLFTALILLTLLKKTAITIRQFAIYLKFMT